MSGEGSRGNSRDVLLNAASNLLREGDTTDLSLSEIAQEAGISSALVKYYFGNKRGLLLGLIERDVNVALRSFVHLLDMSMSPSAKLRHHLEGTVKFHWKYPYLSRLVGILVRDSAPEDAKKISDAYLRPIAQAYGRLIQEGVDRGEFKPIDPMMFYFIVVGACQNLFSSTGVLEHCFDVKELTAAHVSTYADSISSMILSGIQKESTVARQGRSRRDAILA